MTAQDEHTGLQISNSIEIDHAKLGRHFFDWNGHEQAAFLFGARLGHIDLGGYGHLQLRFIVEAATEAGIATEIRDFVELLHEHFKDYSA